MTRTLTTALMALFCLESCTLIQNLSPETRFNDQVFQLNDEARWGRMDLAVNHVHRDYRRRFAASRHRWGREVHIGDTEVTNMQLGGENPVSTVVHSWVDESAMELRSTTINQIWTSHFGPNGPVYELVREEVIDGDDGLLLGVRRIELDSGDTLDNSNQNGEGSLLSESDEGTSS